MKHVDITIRGLVHGVSFRHYTKQKARELNIKGLVRNEPNNSVYIEAEGEEEALDKFISWCKKGPLFASVKNIDCKISHILKNFNKFEIKR